MTADDTVQIEELLAHAPQMQALARTLVRDWDREDVVQEAWVRAIEKPPKHRTNLRSWLGRAVRNRAADLHKREASQIRRVDAAELKGAASTERETAPEELVAQSEALRAVVAELNKLDEPYRHTLLLHYFQGMSLAEIAFELDTPKSTIHSRLQTGRLQLRKRMEQRYGKEAFGMCALATGRTPAAAIATTKPGVAMTWAALALVTVAAVLGGAYFWKEDATENVIVDLPGVAVQPTKNSLVALGAPLDEGRASRSLNSLNSEHAANELIFRGRCIAASDGQPLQGAQIELEWRDSSYPEFEFLAPTDWSAPESLSTDENGRFEIRIQENFSKSFTLWIRPEGCAPRYSHFEAYREPGHAQFTELGDLRFSPGYRVSGIVVDQNGHTPVDRVRVIIRDLPIGIETTEFPNRALFVRTEDDGTFVFEDLVPDGTWEVSITDRSAYRQVDAINVEVDGADSHITLQGAIRPAIRGTIQNADGSLPPRLYLMRTPGTDHGKPGVATWSFPDGTFALFSDEHTPSPYLQVGTLHPTWESSERVAWGTEKLNIQLDELDPESSLQIVATQAGTNRAVTDYAIQFTIPARPGHQESPPRLIGPNTYNQGHCEVTSPVGHPFEFTAIPRKRGLLASEWMSSTQLDPGSGVAQVEFGSLNNVDVNIVHVDGNAVSNALVQVIEYTDLPPTVEQRRFKYGRAKANYGYVLIDQSRTNEQGQVSIFARDDLKLALRIIDGESTHIVAPFDSSQASEIRIGGDVLPSFRFELTRPANWPRVGVITDPDDGIFYFGSFLNRIAWFDADGLAEIEIRKPGPCVADLVVESEGFIEPTRLFASRLKVSTTAGEPPLFHFDPTAFFPGGLNGKILVDGTPANGGYVIARCSQSATELHPTNWPTARLNFLSTEPIDVNKNGEFSIPHLLPGMVEVSYSTSSSRSEGMLPSASQDSVRIVSGSATQAEFGIQPQGLRLQIRNADGTPYTSSEVSVLSSRYHYPRTTGSDGMLELDGIPLHGVHIEVPCDRGIIKLGILKPDTDQRWTDHELTLPE